MFSSFWVERGQLRNPLRRSIHLSDDCETVSLARQSNFQGFGKEMEATFG